MNCATCSAHEAPPPSTGRALLLGVICELFRQTEIHAQIDIASRGKVRTVAAEPALFDMPM